MELYENIAAIPSLIKGFNQVSANDGAPGFDKVTIYDFEEDLENQIRLLHNELASFNYQPKPVIFFEREKADGGKRLLSIYSVRDRTAQASAMQILNPIFETNYEDESFGFRKGYSRETAARQINKLYEEGFKWIVDADIKQYFDSVNHDLLFEKLNQIVKEKRVIDLLTKWIQAEYIVNGKKNRVSKGLVQGSVVSPMLANIYLDKFDEDLKKEGYKLIRYADDFIIMTKEKPEAEQALKLTKEILKSLQLEINEQKTTVKSFDEGFKYLGYIFLKSLIVPASNKDTSRLTGISRAGDLSRESLDKIYTLTKIKTLPGKEKTNDETKLDSSEIGAALLEALNKKGITLDDFLKSQSETVNKSPIPGEEEVEKIILSEEEEFENEETEKEENPAGSNKTEVPASPQIISFKRTLYIQEQGAVLKKEAERFIIIKNETELLNVPVIKVSQIIIFGTCTITPAVMQLCIKKLIPITLLSSRGKYYGSIESTFANNADFERLQIFRTLDEQFLLQFAKSIITGKITNQKTILQRFLKRSKDDEIEEAVNSLNHVLKRIDSAKTIDDVRGYEGVSASYYFRVYGRLFNKSAGFYKENFIRTRRPPLDPVNSLLSFGYTMIAANIFSFVKARGLNPYCGYMHSIRPGHRAIVSD